MSESEDSLEGLRILLVDDDVVERSALAARLVLEGYDIVEASTGAQGRAMFEEGGVDLVLLDQGLPDEEGLAVLRAIRSMAPAALVVMLTGDVSIDTAVHAVREGAYNYLTKPLDLEQIVVAVARALETQSLRRELQAARTSRGIAVPELIGTSASMVRIDDLLTRFARSPSSTVLLTGESGTGKDVAARIIHARSERVDRPFTNITCSALPDALLESELFGHEKGSFTGAHQQKKGLLEIGQGGTVFLDEIGELSAGVQAKLLRFLESKTFRRVGGSKDITVDVRIVAATNRDLREEVRCGRFREDLFYRLSVLHTHLPALRERLDDIPALVHHFVSRFELEFHKRLERVGSSTMDRLSAQSWPGNVRQLRNAVERAVLLADRGVLEDDDFDVLDAILPISSVGSSLRSLHTLPVEGVNLQELERDLLTQAVERSRGNRTRAGRLLGLNRDQVRYRLAKMDEAAAEDQD